MPEITLEQTGTDSIEDLIPMTNLINQILPNADSRLKTKLRIKIYNLSRTRNWPWVTVNKRRYYKLTTAKIIVGSVSDYANAIAKREQEDKVAAAKPKPKAKKVRLVRTPKIIEYATKNTALNKDMKQRLRKRILYIAKMDLIKPAQGRTIYSVKDAKQLVPELASYYQQLQHDTFLNEKAKSRLKNNKDQRQNNTQQIKRENNTQSQQHPFETKNDHNNYPYYKRRQNYNQNKNLQEHYNNLLRNYTRLEERYNKLLNEKNNLINEKANQLANKFINLRDILAEVLKHY